MLPSPDAPSWSAVDQEVFQRLIPADHYLRRALASIDFARFGPELAKPYSPDQGRPAEQPVRMLKLEFLQYHDILSDRQVIARAQTDVAYRYFLGLSLADALPDPSLLCVFRGRLGVEGHRRVFEDLVSQARAHGLVKDRLRLKDATHVIADVAVPAALALVAQTRDKLLAAAHAFDPLRVAGERAQAEVVRAATDGRAVEERLTARVTHLREILAWVDELPPPADAETHAAWQALAAIRRLAHKILHDREHPQDGDLTRSVVDPDARRAKHGEWFDGYLLDVMIDADSELITAVEVLPGNGDEAADAAPLVQQEEAAQGNDVQALSLDGIGFQGPVLRELQDPQGLALDLYVPPKAEPESEGFAPQDFVEDAAQGVVVCPAGQTSAYRQRNERDTGSIYRFRRTTCQGCPLLGRCMGHPPRGKFGKTIRKNDYQGEYDAARRKAQTAEYEAVRREHPKIERKLAELVRRHGARRARYRGSGKVLIQALLTALVANVKRMERLLSAPVAAPAGT